MDQIYKRLAKHFDQIPNGYPTTKSGVELEILAELFLPEEATVACRMSQQPQSANEICTGSDQNERETTLLLKGMVRKGLIELKRARRELTYYLMPFMVGFYERQNANIDERFARLFENYYREEFHKVMTQSPSVHRVIPIEKTIPVDVEVMPYQRASDYLDSAASWGVLPCICRVQKRLVGESCCHTEESCVVFSARLDAFNRTERIRSLTKGEAKEILIQSASEGLVHTTGNFRDGVSYICNCCTCSCGILRGIVEYGALSSVARSDFLAVVDCNMCSGCEICLSQCQFAALTISENNCQVEKSRCFGCGHCITSCPTGALSLQQKPREEIITPPETEADWFRARAESRWGSDRP